MIDVILLRGAETSWETLEDRLKFFSVATRLSWAAVDIQTRAEDMAYRIIGLFNINMPLPYGEGRRAFPILYGRRLLRSAMTSQS